MASAPSAAVLSAAVSPGIHGAASVVPVGPSSGGPRDLAFSIDPISWLGDGLADAAGDAFQTAMTALWSAGLWMLKLAFEIIDAFTTPDVSGNGPLGAVLPTTLGIGAAVAVLMMSVQLATAMLRRDGQSLGRVVIGIGQFAVVWAGYLTVATVFVTAASGLEHTILRQMLHVDTLSSYDLLASWPRKVSDLTVATVLGFSAIFLVIPAAFAYVLMMLVREAALIILVATSPITAAGLLAESTKSWFWKSLRWFISSLLIAPTSALVLGIGVQVSNGVISGKGDKTAAAVGTAVVGALIIAIGATSPLVLFRLLAFVEPGTASGAALRQSWSDAGGMSGVMSGGAGKSGGGSKSSGDTAGTSQSDGRSGGESTADGQTQSRMAGMLGGGAVGKAAGGTAGGIGSGLGKVAGGVGAVARAAVPIVSAAQRAVDIGSDVLGQSGVGSPGYSMTPTDERSSRRGQSPSGSQGGGESGGGGSGGQPSPGSGGDAGGGGGGGGGGPQTAGPRAGGDEGPAAAQQVTREAAGIGGTPDTQSAGTPGGQASGGQAGSGWGMQPELPGLGGLGDGPPYAGGGGGATGPSVGGGASGGGQAGGAGGAGGAAGVESAAVVPV